MRRRKMLRRKTGLKPYTPNPRKTRRTRADAERIYGPPERRAWIREQPCAYCLDTPVDGCHNAHICNGGMGRKADYTKIVPLCPSCHGIFGTPGEDAWWGAMAAYTERRWQDHLSRQM